MGLMLIFNMPKKKFRFFIKDNVQDVGCRGFVIAEMLNYGFERATAINLPDGRVEVRIDGEESDVKDFIENLKEKLRLKYPNPLVEIRGVEATADLYVPDIMHSSQAHLLVQFDKAIDVLKGLPKEIANEMKKELPRAISAELKKDLPKEMAAELKPFMVISKDPNS